MTNLNIQGIEFQQAELQCAIDQYELMIQHRCNYARELVKQKRIGQALDVLKSSLPYFETLTNDKYFT